MVVRCVRHRQLGVARELARRVVASSPIAHGGGRGTESMVAESFLAANEKICAGFGHGRGASGVVDGGRRRGGTVLYGGAMADVALRAELARTQVSLFCAVQALDAHHIFGERADDGAAGVPLLAGERREHKKSGRKSHRPERGSGSGSGGGGGDCLENTKTASLDIYYL